MRNRGIVILAIGICLLLPSVSGGKINSCCLHRGDVDHSGGADPINIADLTYLVDFLFTGGPEPPCPEEGDIDASGGAAPINVADVTYLVHFLFLGGGSPPSCETGIPDSIQTSPVTLQFGQGVLVDSLNIELTFESVVTDCRCPTQVFCFWEGFAEIGLRVLLSPTDTHFVTLPIMGGIIQPDGFSLLPIDVLGYRFTLLQLLPYPMHPDSLIPDWAYVATISVEPRTSPDSLNGEVIIAHSAWVKFPSDEFTLDSVSLSGDVINLSVTYSGGCKDHYFSLYMSPGAFSGSNPRRADLLLRHFSDGDDCEALITEQISFSLQPLLDLYWDIYGQYDDILLNVGDYSVLYTPPPK